MKKIELNNRWKLIGMEPQSSSSESIVKPDLQQNWMNTVVPGDVNDTLLKNGLMPDPHYDTQAMECYWVTSKEWWYALQFDMEEPIEVNTDLCLTNVDGCAEIWLNDFYIGETKNAFRLHRFSIQKYLKQKDNLLYVRFKSIDQLLGPRIDRLAGWKGRRAFIRKPQFSFGWDWALPLPSIGLSGAVWLEYDNECRMVDFSVQPFIDGRVDFAFEVTEAAKKEGYTIEIKLWGHGNNLVRVLSRDAYKTYAHFELKNPKLWYPNGYGEQPLYRYQADLIVNGRVKDTKSGRIGLRESRIIERPFTPDAGDGYSFGIEINGIPIFCKGGNWIPMEIWPGTIKPEQYEFYLKTAQKANFNMMRIWGGGIYEHEYFYDLCDELGIMVWQDFMFASTGYPVDLLRDEIIAEADYQIRRLRNRPCIVLWCGCNEDIYSWSYNNDASKALQQDIEDSVESDKEWRVDRLHDDPILYTMILRGLTDKLGHGVPYIESSPQSRDDYGNMPNSGNCHISAWKYSLFECNGQYQNWRNHFNQVCSYDSEFCIQGPSSVKMIKSFLKPENHWPPNDAWIYHIQRGHKNIPHHEQTLMIAGSVFGEIDSLQKYVKYGQALHVEMMRSEFESARRDFPNNGGTMMWMYNDCWPTANWSIIDYSKNPKPSYYAAKRACEPLLPVIFERNGTVEFLFSNQTVDCADVTFVYGQEDIDGNSAWMKTKSFLVDPNCTKIIESFKRESIDIQTGDYLFIRSNINGVDFPVITYFPGGWKEIKWPVPKVHAEIKNQRRENNGWETIVTVSTRQYARLLHLLPVSDELNMSFSDNYFDLPAGCTREIVIQSERQIKIEDLKTGHWLSEWE